MPTVLSDTKKHLSDMAGAYKHVLEAVDSQLETAAVKQSPEAVLLLAETKSILSKDIAEFDALLDRHDAETNAGLKKLFTNILGNLAGAYNHLRGEGAARAVRDTYTALSLLNASLLALKTFGLSVGKPDISKLAYDQLGEICPLIIKFNKLIPYVVARETAFENGLAYDVSIPERVETSTQKLWT